MGMHAFKLSRRAVLAASALAAGTLVGCQSTGQQFAQPGVARGDHKSPTSPAFAQVEAGRQLSNHSGRMSPQMAMQSQPGMMAPGMVMASHQVSQQGMPMMGSGGMAYPVSYVGSGQASMQPMMPQQSMMPMGQMQQPVMMPMQQMQQPAMTMMQGMPGTITPAAPPAPAGQPLYMLVNGPNGPQYVQVDSVPSGAVPASSAHVSMTVPASNQIVTMPAPEPTPAPAPTSAPAPTPAPAPAIPAAPTFVAPPPAFVPTPMLAPPSIEMSNKAPESLPKSISDKPPTGPVLPASDTAGPSLGAFPAAPAPAPSAGHKLPQPNGGASDDFIPPAPVFLPSGR